MVRGHNYDPSNGAMGTLVMLIRYLGTNPTIDLLNNSPTFNDMNIKN